MIKLSASVGYLFELSLSSSYKLIGPDVPIIIYLDLRRPTSDSSLDTQHLESAISTSLQLLRRVTGGNPDRRVVEEHRGQAAVQRLLSILGTAQSLWDTISNSTASRRVLVKQVQVEIAHETLIGAIKDVQMLLNDIDDPDGVDETVNTSRAHAAVVNALKASFKKAPFQISAADLEELIP
ncbi:hypothetical protein FRC17_011181, partial [Serendipita sp. 399]